jgi:hypothetical protein
VKTSSSALVVGAVAGVALSLLAGPAQAEGAEQSEALGSGSQYLLGNSLGSAASTFLVYGDPADHTYFGDWDGNGTDTPLVRRGNTFFARDSNTSGPADVVFSYGDAGDQVLVGDWDGNGTDTLAVRRGNSYFVKNAVTTGRADAVVVYGDPADAVLVGDWDGAGGDTLAVHRGTSFFVKNSISSGVADTVITYGDPGDRVLAGDWDGNGTDTLGVQRGNTYYVRNSVTTGVADDVSSYGAPGDSGFVGDWDGNGTDTLGVRVEQGSRVLGSTGLGALHLGMSRDQAQATGLVAPFRYEPNSPGCLYRSELRGVPADSDAGTVFHSTELGVATIDAYPGVQTPEGITIGSSMAAVLQAYPGVATDASPGRVVVPVPGNPAAGYRIAFIDDRVAQLTLQFANQDCYE